MNLARNSIDYEQCVHILVMCFIQDLSGMIFLQFLRPPCLSYQSLYSIPSFKLKVTKGTNGVTSKILSVTFTELLSQAPNMMSGKRER